MLTKIKGDKFKEWNAKKQNTKNFIFLRNKAAQDFMWKEK